MPLRPSTLLPVCHCLGLLLASCADGTSETHDTGEESGDVVVSLVEDFSADAVHGAPPSRDPVKPLEWRFEEDAGSAGAVDGGSAGDESLVRALHGVDDLGRDDGLLVGTTGEHPLLVLELPARADPRDLLHAIEVRMRVSAGKEAWIGFGRDAELDEEELLEALLAEELGSLSRELKPGGEIETYTFTSADSRMGTSVSLDGVKRLFLLPTDAEAARVELESVRLISRAEHLASVPSGVSWHGLAEIYRETIVARVPERIVYELEVGAGAYLDLAIGTLDGTPVTFVVSARDLATNDEPATILRRTITTPGRWASAPAELAAFADKRVELTLALEAEEPGALGFWGGPVVRHRDARATLSAPDPALVALVDAVPAPPRGVIFILADTLRRDHLPAYGYRRDNSPTITRLANEGALFEDAISQGSWTKVAATSLLTGMYASTHGLSDMSDRLPASATTIAEAYREAGYATFATSSVPFTGKLSNLQQGVDVLLERGAVEGDFMAAKTARPFLDHLLEWIERHRDGPFFAFLHVFDPHSPFEPNEPWNTRWFAPDALAEHREHMEQVKQVIESDFMKRQALPNAEEMEASGVDRATYLERQKIWYDASIRAMDAEIARLLERLDELGLAGDTLIALVSDHGEEFLEHGRSFHGYTTYGEMLNVPMILWWPGVVPAGVRVAETVETISLMPTLLSLSRIPIPDAVQGRSLLPLLSPTKNASELGWSQRPVFSERRIAPLAFGDDPSPVTSFVIIDNPWKLVWNTVRPDGWPEYELYDHVADPLNENDLAAENADVIARLAEELEAWRDAAEAARVETDEAADYDPEELEHLRALGYVR